MIPGQRNARIDFLRGAAISCVLLLHFTLSYGLEDSPLGTLLGPRLVGAIAYNGNFGVTVFFVISGYLITTNTLLRWGSLARLDVRAFYLARARRILPGLLLALILIVVPGLFGVPDFSNVVVDNDMPAVFFLLAAGSVLTFWHNVLMQSYGYFNYCLNIYWSLSVEEMFYLLLPPAALLLRRTSLFVLLCVGAVVLGPYYRSLHADNDLYFMYGYAACFDAIALGCLTALLAHSARLPLARPRMLRLCAGVALVAAYLHGIKGNEVFGFTWVALAAAAFLFSCAHDAAPGWCDGKASARLRWMGRHSYELYLFHIIVLATMRNVLSKADMTYALRLPWLVLFLVLSGLAAALATRVIARLQRILFGAAIPLQRIPRAQ